MLANSKIGQTVEHNNFGIPESEDVIDGIDGKNFPPGNLAMKLYSRNLPETKKLYNHRQSKGSFHIENTFGILAVRWCIFQQELH